jgi:hypothetical protein
MITDDVESDIGKERPADGKELTKFEVDSTLNWARFCEGNTYEEFGFDNGIEGLDNNGGEACAYDSNCGTGGNIRVEGMGRTGRCKPLIVVLDGSIGCSVTLDGSGLSK